MAGGPGGGVHQHNLTPQPPFHDIPVSGAEPWALGPPSSHLRTWTLFCSSSHLGTLGPGLPLLTPGGLAWRLPVTLLSPTSFWKRLSRLMSKVNPEPNVIHIMGCYILGNPNGEKVQESQTPLQAFRNPRLMKRLDKTHFSSSFFSLFL